MSSRPDPDEAAAPLPPIVSLDEVRRRRRPSAAPARGAGHACDRDTLQRELLAEAVRGGRLCSADLFAMVRLGIVTDDLAMLPCTDPHRSKNALDWERRHMSGEAAQHPSPSRVGCPLMAQAASGAAAPACIEALRQQEQIPAWRPDGGFGLRPLDGADPVVRLELRPCLLLSRELFRHLLLPLWQQERREP